MAVSPYRVVPDGRGFVILDTRTNEPVMLSSFRPFLQGRAWFLRRSTAEGVADDLACKERLK